MPTLLFQIINLLANVIIFIFVGYYLLRFSAKEKELEKKEGKIDTDYHQIVDTALARERKILEDAANEASQIITGAQYINQASKETVNHALQKIVADVQKDALATAHDFTTSYQATLRQLAEQSLREFQQVTKGLEGDLQKQITEFHESLLPNLEKELEAYKQARLNQTEQMIARVVQATSQEVLNKSIPLDDQRRLIIDSLENAKKEGVFG